MTKIWVVEHREIPASSACRCMESVVMSVWSTEELAIQYIVDEGVDRAGNNGWYAVYYETINNADAMPGPIKFYDIQGNEITEQPV